MSATAVDNWKLLNEPLHGIYIPVALYVGGCAAVGATLEPRMGFYGLGLLVAILAVRVLAVLVTGLQRLHAVKWRKFELLDKTIVLRNLAIYRFKLPREDDALDIPVGHHLACCFVIDGKDEIRYYTPILSHLDRGFFDILVKLYPTGKVLKQFAMLQVGQTVMFRGPVGRMLYEHNMAKEIAMVAGGSGITPILAVLLAIVTDPNDTTTVLLIYANQTENDILLRDELDEFSLKYPGFTVHYTLEQPPREWSGDVGYPTKAMMQKYLPLPGADKRLFVCGPPAMNAAVVLMAEELGWGLTSKPSQQDDTVFVF